MAKQPLVPAAQWGERFLVSCGYGDYQFLTLLSSQTLVLMCGGGSFGTLAAVVI